MVQSRRSKYLACLLVAAATSGALYAKPDLDLAPSFESLDLTTVLRICPPKVQLPTPDDERCTSNTAESIAATQKMQLYTEPFMGARWNCATTAKDDRIICARTPSGDHRTRRRSKSSSDRYAPAMRSRGRGCFGLCARLPCAAAGISVAAQSGRNEKCLRDLDSILIWSRAWGLRCTLRGITIDELPGVTNLHARGLLWPDVEHDSVQPVALSASAAAHVSVLRTLLSCTSLSVMYMGLFGHGFAFIWPDAFLWQKYSHSAAKFTAAIFGIAFFSAVLNVPQRMPRLYGKIKLAYPAFVVAAVVSPLLSPQGIFLIATIVVAIAVIYSLALGVLSAVGKLPFSFYYAIAMIAMLGGALINLLQTAAILPSNTFTLHAMQVGTALEAIFLSIALGDRYSAIEGENHALQHQRLEDKKRIARDIHDVIGTEFQMRLIEIQSEGESALSSKLVSGLRSTLDKIREFLFLLHTEEHLPAKLEKTIEELLRRLELAKKFEIERDIIIDAQAIGTTEAYHIERAVSEIISNIARHAQASKIVFTLRINKQGGFLAVRDNGVGFEKTLAAKNIGMESLGYRAERLRGRLKILTSMGRGTTVALRFRGQA
jgi:signal transduction histidine kinase